MSFHDDVYWIAPEGSEIEAKVSMMVLEYTADREKHRAVFKAVSDVFGWPEHPDRGYYISPAASGRLGELLVFGPPEYLNQVAESAPGLVRKSEGGNPCVGFRGRSKAERRAEEAAAAVANPIPRVTPVNKTIRRLIGYDRIDIDAGRTIFYYPGVTEVEGGRLLWHTKADKTAFNNAMEAAGFERVKGSVALAMAEKAAEAVR